MIKRSSLGWGSIQNMEKSPENGNIPLPGSADLYSAESAGPVRYPE